MFKNIEVTQDLLNYIYNHSQKLHPIQKDILKYNINLGDQQRMQISEAQALFLQLLIKLMNIKNCLEIGTFTGFSAFSMALALPKKGKLITLDKDRKILKIAENFFKKGKLNQKIKIYQGYALDNLKKLHKQKRKFELIFIDADKANYKNYYDLSLNLLQKNGFIIFDNVLWKGNVINNNINDKNTNVIRNFNKYIKNDFKIDKIIIPLGDGLTICRKLK
tara:strand:+ start:891 stop:1550 length:660 start_codon:yes stop_codon:yes gene_type:complete